MRKPDSWRRDMDENLLRGMIAAVRAFPTELPSMLISEWAEQKRVLPRGLTPIPGQFSFSVTPYLREIVDCFAETSPVRRVAVLKGAQIGATTGILENIIGAIIDMMPGPAMFISGDKSTAETSVELRVLRMIESAGLGGKIFSQSESRHNKKTGQSKGKLEFPGGFLLPVGPRTGSKLRSFSIRYLLADEIDCFPIETGDGATREGDPIALAEKRTSAFEAISKVLYLSTPLGVETSRIIPLYEAGDRRKWFVPCWSCGEYQILEWGRIKFERDEKGKLIWDSVHYECAACQAHWKNAQKAEFLGKGEWRPTAEPSEPGFRSYFLPSLYAPLEFASWERQVQEWLAAQRSPMRLRVFLNTVLAEGWQERGEAPQHERIMLRREQYVDGSLPETAKPLFVVCGADVQGDRIECEIVAFGANMESWSIAYYVIPGRTDNVESEAWTSFANVLTSPHAGLKILICLIDSRHNTPVVNQFCARGTMIFPLEGDNRVGRYQRLFMKREAVGFPGLRRIDLYTAPLKVELYNYLRQGAPDEGQPFPAGYAHFPSTRSEKFFRGLVAEELVRTRTKTGQFASQWVVRGGRANEPHDCRIYCMAAVHVLADLAREDEGVDSESWSWPDFWQYAERRLRPFQKAAKE